MVKNILLNLALHRKILGYFLVIFVRTYYYLESAINHKLLSRYALYKKNNLDY